MRSTEIRASGRVDEEFHQGVTDDGLRVRVIPRPGYAKKFAIFVTDYGSIDTAFQAPGSNERHQTPPGVAHFLEHKLFQTEEGDAFSEFARYGASANAFTSYTQTAYHFGTSSDFYPCLDLLLDFVAVPYFTPEAIDKERKVIAQEIRMYEDSPDAVAHLDLLQALYHNHPVREDITGSLDSICAIDGDILRLCHQTFYNPENMVLVVSGDLDPSEVFARTEAARGRLSQPPPAGRVARHLPDEPREARESLVERRLAVALPKVLLGSKEKIRAGGPEGIRAQREVRFLLELVFGRASAFFEDHSATGLIDDTFYASLSAGRGGYAHIAIGGETPKPEAFEGAIRDAIERAKRDGLSADDFTRLRNKAWGRYLRGFNSLSGVAYGEVDATLEGWDLLGYLDMLEQIQLSDLEARLRTILDPACTALSIVRPLE